MGTVSVGLSQQEAVAIWLRRRIEDLKGELAKAADLNMEVSLIKSGTNQTLDNLQNGTLVVSVKAKL